MKTSGDLFINLLDPANILFTESYVKELQAGEVGAENITVCEPNDDAQQGFVKLAEWLAFCEKHQDKIQLVMGADDLELAKSRGKVGIILGTQSATPIGEDLNLVGAFHRLGLRTLGIAYQGRNSFGDGCAEPKDSGLSKLGERLVNEANRVGMVLDLSHTGRKTTLEAIELSRDPVMFSHSNVKALCNHIQNVDDEQIKALGEKKGLLAVAAFGPLLRRDQRGTMDDLIDHIDYVVKLVGADCVGLGLDAFPLTPPSHPFHEEFRRRYPEMAGVYSHDTTIEGLKHPAEWKNVVTALTSRGYSKNDVRKIVGENAIRIFKRVWKS